MKTCTFWFDICFSENEIVKRYLPKTLLGASRVWKIVKCNALLSSNWRYDGITYMSFWSSAICLVKLDVWFKNSNDTITCAIFCWYCLIRGPIQKMYVFKKSMYIKKSAYKKQCKYILKDNMKSEKKFRNAMAISIIQDWLWWLERRVASFVLYCFVRHSKTKSIFNWF